MITHIITIYIMIIIILTISIMLIMLLIGGSAVADKRIVMIINKQ